MAIFFKKTLNITTEQTFIPMPAYISISNKEKNWLKALLEEQFEITINNSFACKQLSSLISKKNRVLVSYNTLRRLFEIVDSKSKPSQYTLNLLANTIGFTSFNDFQTYIHKFDTDIINELIITFYEQKKIDESLLMAYLENFVSPSWQELYQLKNVIDLCIKTSHYSCLKKIIAIKFNPDTEEFLEKFTVCFQTFYFESENGNKKLNQFILNNIPNSEILQRILLQVYIRENLLHDFWGTWLENATLQLVEDMPVFKNTLLCQKLFEKNELNQARIHLKKAKDFFRYTTHPIHPILIGRMAAWEIILKANVKFAETELEKIETLFEKICFIVFYYRLLFTYNENNKHLDLIETITLRKLSVSLGAFDKKIVNKYLLILAFHYHAKNLIAKSKALFEEVDPLRLDAWESDWFIEKYNFLSKKLN